MATKPRNSQHQEHQLGVLWTPNPETASIRSISWAYFGHQTTKQPASGASAGRTLHTKPRNSQHQEHQLGVLWTPNPETASIRSISWAYFGHQTPKQPAGASAGRTLDTKPRNSQHQEHQLGVLWTPNPETASIRSISWAYFGHQTPKQPASGASAGRTLDTRPRNSQHHEHQLGVLWTRNPETASIMSISWAYFGHQIPKQPASGASAGRTLDTKPRNCQHHEHQLGVLWTPNPETASISSISWAYFAHQTSKQPASGASAGRTLDTKPRNSQHHEHQLGVLWTPNPKTASIMSISWAYFGHQTRKQPASAASAGRTLDTRPRNSQHHEHQLGVLWTLPPKQPAS